MSAGVLAETEIREAASSPPERTAPGARQRLAFAAALGLAVFGLSFYWQGKGNLGDLDQVLFAARALLEGKDPYALIGRGREFHWAWPLYYPGTAMTMVVPLTWIPPVLARALFVGVSTALLAWAVTGRGWQLAPLFLSAPFIGSVEAVQWTPLLTAAYGIPVLAWVWVAKPNFALPFLLARPSRRMVVALALGGGVLLAISLLLDPDWPARWLPLTLHAEYVRPPIAALLGGPLLLLALLRWRQPEARLLLGMACVPQTIANYNALPLLLVARTRLETMVLALLSWVVTLVQMVLVALPRPLDERFTWIMGANVWLMYLPALWIVLRRREPKRAPAGATDATSPTEAVKDGPAAARADQRL